MIPKNIDRPSGKSSYMKKDIKVLPSLAIVVPCYNEEQVFPECLAALTQKLVELINNLKISPESHIIFVDDGSKDRTWELIRQASEEDNKVRGLKLSKNQGHQTALIAGLTDVDTDICISIDADLQDDIGCINKMVDEYMKGHEIVYGVRNDRTSDSFFKRFTANSFYKVMSRLGVNQVENHADYRLLSQRALQSLLALKERNIYIRGMVPLLGYSSSQVTYRRNERFAGESKYPLKKMLALAIEGITSLTVTPLRIISLLGFATCLLSLFAILYAIVQKFEGNAMEGWTSVTISIFFLGGIQLICLGVIGEYVGKIYLETKNRPKFFIEESTKGNNDENN